MKPSANNYRQLIANVVGKRSKTPKKTIVGCLKATEQAEIKAIKKIAKKLNKRNKS
jgi:hypothetical protein